MAHVVAKASTISPLYPSCRGKAVFVAQREAKVESTTPPLSCLSR